MNKKSSVITSIAYEGSDGIHQANVVREDFRVWRVDAWRWRKSGLHGLQAEMKITKRFDTIHKAQAHARAWVDREGSSNA